MPKQWTLSEARQKYKDSSRFLNKPEHLNMVKYSVIKEAFEKFIDQNSLSGYPYNEQLYMFFNNITTHPRCKTCDSEDVNFKGRKIGFSDFCSVSCSKKHPDTQAKYRASLKEKYGTEDLLNSDQLQKKIREKYNGKHFTQTEEFKEKQKQKNIEKYGHESYFQTKEFKEKAKQTNLKKRGVESHNQSQEVIEKKKKIWTEKYGVDNPAKAKEVQSKIQETNLERYGVENPQQNTEIKEKTNQTNIEKYGHAVPAKNTEVIKRTKASNLQKYGVDNTLQTEKAIAAKEAVDKKIREKHYVDGYTLIQHGKGEEPSKFKCPKEHEFELKHWHFVQRKYQKITVCTVCNPLQKQYSDIERQIYEYIASIYNGQIEQNIRFGKDEIDLYFPELNIGIEVNGLYWHSELFKDKNYHINKTKKFKEKGIRIIHIWEDQWYEEPLKVKSFFATLFGNNTSIGARKCELKEITGKEEKEFLNQHHLQGHAVSKYRFGLKYDNELLAVMTFSKARTNLNQKEKYDFELLRFATKSGNSIPGGAQRLFKHFTGLNPNATIVCYANLDHFTGALYNKLGFNEVGETGPGYWWIVKGRRENRFNYRKDKLVAEGADPSKTEVEIMTERGHYRLWNCGNKKYQIS